MADSENEGRLSEISKPYSDRVSQYLIRQSKQSPRRFFVEVRKYWVLGIVLNVIGIYFMSMGIATSLKKNSEASLNIVRVDGVRIEESRDVRRDVLMENTLKRNELQNSKD